MHRLRQTHRAESKKPRQTTRKKGNSALIALNAVKPSFWKPMSQPAIADLLEALRGSMLGKLPEPDSPTYQLVETKGSAAVSDQKSSLLKTLMKNMFKADHPYRTRLGLTASIATSGSGLLNVSFSIQSIATTGEWSSIDALFDEVFVHAMRFEFRPDNVWGGGETQAVGTVGGQPTFAAAAGRVTSCGLSCVSLFGNAGLYTSHQGMLSNPNLRSYQTNHPFKYVWRNQVRFDPHGLNLSSGSAVGWSGWTSIAGTANIFGTIQIRCFNDQVLGDQANAFTLGQYAIVFDASFRSRA